SPNARRGGANAGIGGFGGLREGREVAHRDLALGGILGWVGGGRQRQRERRREACDEGCGWGSPHGALVARTRTSESALVRPRPRGTLRGAWTPVRTSASSNTSRS